MKEHKPKQERGAWIGIKVEEFVDCMKECEKDVEPWEIWLHAKCVAKCLIKAGTGGGSPFTDKP